MKFLYLFFLTITQITSNPYQLWYQDIKLGDQDSFLCLDFNKSTHCNQSVTYTISKTEYQGESRMIISAEDDRKQYKTLVAVTDNLEGDKMASSMEWDSYITSEYFQYDLPINFEAGSDGDFKIVGKKDSTKLIFGFLNLKLKLYTEEELAANSEIISNFRLFVKDSNTKVPLAEAEFGVI